MICSVLDLLVATVNPQGGTLFDDYLVIDTETTGFADDDLMYDLGYARVEGRKLVKAEGLLINWLTTDFVSYNWLDKRIRRVQSAMVDQGYAPPPSVDYLQQHGRPYDVVTEEYLAILEQAKADRLPILMHGGLKFDCPRLQKHFKEFIGAKFAFPKTRVVDTAAIEKACILDFGPLEGESYFDFSVRLTNAHSPKGTKYNLASCVQRYELHTRHGLDFTKLHGAKPDCVATHHLFENMRLRYAKREGKRI